MFKKFLLGASVAISICLLMASFAGAQSLAYYSQGAILSNAPDYHWWYGCSPTSAGMMMGYYDINGYGGLLYPNLVPGGTAELDNYPPSPTSWSSLANNAIASTGHVADFWTGYGNTGDPMAVNHQFNCLADFMGTSQWALGNRDGSTTFYFYTSGSKFHDYNAVAHGVWNSDGMYGIGEYVNYAGYGYGAENLYTQLIPGGLGYSAPLGFTWNEYMAEIDAGRVVMLHVRGHSMFGYGYGPGNLVYLHDTWSPKGQHTMTWGGAYQGLDMWGVTVFEPTGGIIPEPGTFLLLGSGLLALALFRKKRK